MRHDQLQSAHRGGGPKGAQMCTQQGTKTKTW